MANVYSLEQAQKSKKEESQVSQEMTEEARRIEQQNYERAKGMRKKLDKSSLEQKATTAELKRQGETLKGARSTAVGLNVGAKRGEKLAEDIEREGHIFTCWVPCISCIEAIKNWFKKDTGNIDDVINKEEPEPVEEEPEEEPKPVEFDENQEEYIEGQNKTDKEMLGVLSTVRSVRKEADRQYNEISRQKSTVKDISTITERSGKVIKKTDEELQKIE
jgi:hypothetical protein